MQLRSIRDARTHAAMRHSLALAVLWLAAPCQGWVARPPRLCKAAAAPPRRGRRGSATRPRTASRLLSKDDDELPEETIGDAWEAGLENGRAIGKTVVARFASPRVDDQGLIIADALARRPVWKSNFGRPTPRWLDGITTLTGRGHRGPGARNHHVHFDRISAAELVCCFWSEKTGRPDFITGRDAVDVLVRRRVECAALRARRLRLSAAKWGGRQVRGDI